MNRFFTMRNRKVNVGSSLKHVEKRMDAFNGKHFQVLTVERWHRLNFLRGDRSADFESCTCSCDDIGMGECVMLSQLWVGQAGFRGS